MKRCSSCSITKSYSEYYNNKALYDGYSTWCKWCINKYSRTARLGRYGLSREQFNYLLEQQDYRCAICQVIFDAANTAVIDHDHACCPVTEDSGRLNKQQGLKNRCGGSCVRGLLCISCNAGLGMFKDDKQRLISAVKYLTSYLGDDYPIEVYYFSLLKESIGLEV